MAGIYDDIIKTAKEFDTEYKKARGSVDDLKKQYLSALNGGKDITDGLKDAGMALAARRKTLEEILASVDFSLKIAEDCAVSSRQHIIGRHNTVGFAFALRRCDSGSRNSGKHAGGRHFAHQRPTRKGLVKFRQSWGIE